MVNKVRGAVDLKKIWWLGTYKKKGNKTFTNKITLLPTYLIEFNSIYNIF